jgi:MFS transporter, DHA1 family, inner membrane transport protein
MDASITPAAPAQAEQNTHRAALWALLFGNFVIGAGILAPAGLINELRQAFNVDVATVGTLIGYGAVVLCFGAPLFAYVTNRLDRRTLLTGSLVLYTAGHFASAFAPSFTTLLAIRVVMVIAAAVFTPQAASAVTLLVPQEKRASAVAFIFLGWSLASACGIPAATLLGAHAGWSMAYLAIGLACALAAVGVGLTLPGGLHTPALSLHSWKCVLSSGKILLVLAVTAFALAGQFTLYPFVAAELKSFGATTNIIATLLALFGVAGVVGAAISTVAIGRLGAPLACTICLIAVAIGLVAWSASIGSLALAAISMAIWGLGLGPANSAQQARLIAADPPVASASVALNTSCIYVGQAFGTFVGGRLLTVGHASVLGYVGAGLVGLAVIGSLAARFRFRV